MYRDRHFHRNGRWHKNENAEPNPPVGPSISNVVATPSDTTATVEWNVSPSANGRVDYGTDVGYGLSTTQETSYLSFHSQDISDLEPGTLYYYRIVSAKSDGGQSVYESTFTTTGAVAAAVYGSAMNGDDKGNLEIGTTWGGIIAHRFRASSSSAPSYLIWPCRTGTGGYSNGTGGSFRIGIQADDGTANHYPTGTFLTSTDVVPGNPGSTERYLRTDFTGAPSLTANQLYHVVFQNIDAAPNSNWVSVNCMYKTGSAYSPRQPAFEDTDFGVSWRGPAWTPNTSHHPHFDLTLADGTHEGNAYGTGPFDVDQRITGTTQMVRERFTVSGGDKTVTEVYVRVSRLSGSGDLTIRLENDSGVLIEEQAVAGSGIPIGAYRTMNSTGGEWVGYTFATPRTLTSGTTYRLRVSCAAGSTYYARPIRWRTFHHTGTDYMRSRYFVDGTNATYGGAEFTTNSGSSWTGFYAFLPQDLQFYFVTS